MIPELRESFNRQWTPEQYAEFSRELDRKAGTHVDFRLSETPVFLPKDLLDKMARYGVELYGQLAENAAYREASDAIIPAAFKAADESEHPLFVQADFGIVREPDGSLEPKLVEIQGFPSLYALQPTLAQQYRESYNLDSGLRTFLSGLDDESYTELLRKAICGDQEPEQVVLLEIEPYRQKTLADFLLTHKLLGIKIACITQVERIGTKLYYEAAEIKRIYNRVIVDELVRKGISSSFSFSDELEVEWAGHPNWFFKLSKYSLPWFEHVCVPETRFLSDIKELPDNLGEYVLKPLYSFAGSGVTIGPSREEIAAIAEESRANYILQRKMDFVPVVATPEGLTKVEVRIMYIWDGDALKPVTTIIRTGRGKMMGVDFNRSMEWVGASAGFYVPGR